jgi:hypothetical protein
VEPEAAHDRLSTMNVSRRVPALLLVLAVALAACSAGSGGASSPSLSPIGSLAPSNVVPGSPDPSKSASPAPSDGEVSTPDEAAQLVIEENPQFQGIGPQVPDIIGACCWYEATRNADGFQVTIHVGWGDCPSGCIEEHESVYQVTPDGEVTLVSDDGPSVPPGLRPGG